MDTGRLKGFHPTTVRNMTFKELLRYGLLNSETLKQLTERRGCCSISLDADRLGGEVANLR